MKTTLALLAALPLACVPAATAPATAPPDLGAAPLTHGEALELVLERVGDVPLAPDTLPEIRVTVVNHSDRTLPFVLPGDGSWAGWREPSVRVSAERVDPDGTRHPAADRPFARCGNYDANWVDEVIELAPGERRVIFEGQPWSRPHLDRAGTWELTFHYVYEARPSQHDQWGFVETEEKDRFGPMTGVSPFRLDSTGLRVELVEAFDGPR